MNKLCFDHIRSNDPMWSRRHKRGGWELVETGDLAMDPRVLSYRRGICSLASLFAEVSDEAGPRILVQNRGKT